MGIFPGIILIFLRVKFATAAVIISPSSLTKSSPPEAFHIIQAHADCLLFQIPALHQKSTTVSHEMSGLNWKPFVYGGLASIVAEFGTFPVDLTKTRLQVQGQSIDVRFKEIKYRGMFHALFRIYKEEGVLALYSGIAPALLRQASYGTIKIGIYQSLKRLFVERLEDETLLINMICGVVSGVISSTIANPTDVLKIRMQAQGSLFQGSMIGSFIDIYQQEGTRGLWRGALCCNMTCDRGILLVSERLLGFYFISKKYIIYIICFRGTVLPFSSSFTCGLAGALASNPVDVVRTRMMNQRAIVGHVDLYKGTLDGILKMWKHEGFFALYKGFWPNWLRLGPWNIIFFITYEQLKRLQI
uniref:Solute carrier family 25 member 14 n=1 Tax=Mustela putorius furo TaxID=9669 RepID=M3XS98_MUSPF